jgi:hypothetical protein
MENKLEQLLNSLIEKGWLPRWDDKIHSCRYYEEEKKFKADYTIAWIPQVLYRSIRELCSREAGLWQFVCENGMIDKQHWYIDELKWWKADDDEEWHDNWEERYSTEYQFWLIESSLKDESELEDFLLNSIKLD